MSKHTQFFLALIVLGIACLAVLFGGEIAAEAAAVYGGLLVGGLIVVRVAQRRRA